MERIAIVFKSGYGLEVDISYEDAEKLREKLEAGEVVEEIQL